MKKIMILCMFVWNASLSAKNLKWYEGTVVLSDEKAVVGEISFELANDLISLLTLIYWPLKCVIAYLSKPVIVW